MKKITALIMAAITVLGIFAFSINSSALFDSGEVTKNLRSKIYYMENLDEGTVFFEKNSEEKTPPAGFVKILVALVALEKWGNLEGTVTVTEKNLDLIGYDYTVRTADYEAGEVVSKRELFDCLMVYSANDVASIIAYEISGSSEAFIKEMQALITKIGCTSTVINSLTGFDREGQYTTAKDIAKIIKYALNYPAFAEAFSKQEVTLKATDKNEERVYETDNYMTMSSVGDYYHSSVTGGKVTGTDAAGECAAVISNQDGYSYLTVVMGGTYVDIDQDEYEENTGMTDACDMITWVYDNIRYRVIVSPEETVKVVDVVAGKGTDKLRLIPEKETSALVPSKATPASVMLEIVEGTMKDPVVAPVKEGEVVAQAKVYYANQELTTINLVAASDVRLSFFGLIMSGIKSIVGSGPFLVISLILAIAAIAVFVMNFLDYYKKNKGDLSFITDKVKKAVPASVSSKTKKKTSVADPSVKKAARPASQGRGSLASYQSRNLNSDKKTEDKK